MLTLPSSAVVTTLDYLRYIIVRLFVRPLPPAPPRLRWRLILHADLLRHPLPLPPPLRHPHGTRRLHRPPHRLHRPLQALHLRLSPLSEGILDVHEPEEHATFGSERDKEERADG